MGSILVEMFRHNAWANQHLLDACAALSDDQLATAAPGTYGAIRDTLLHLASGQDRYVAALRGEQPSNTLHGRPFPGIPALQEHLGRSSEALVTVAEQGDDDRVVRGIRNGEPYALPASVFLIQAINHATDHRSQIASIMSGMGIEPPEIDGWSYAVSTAALA